MEISNSEKKPIIISPHDSLTQIEEQHCFNKAALGMARVGKEPLPVMPVLCVLTILFQGAPSCSGTSRQLLYLLGSVVALLYSGLQKGIKTRLRSLFLITLFALLNVYLVKVHQPSVDAIQSVRRVSESLYELNRNGRVKPIEIPIEGQLAGELRRRRAGELTINLETQPLHTTYGFGIEGGVQLTAADLPWLPVFKISPEDTVVGTAKIRSILPESGEQPSPVSYEGYLFRRGVVATGDLSLNARVIRNAPSRDVPRERFIKDLFKQFGESDALSVVLASAMGERDLVTPRIDELFRQSGVIHLLIVSGFHVGIMFFIVFKAVKFVLTRSEAIVLWIPVAGPAALAGLIAAGWYAWLAGFEPTSARALVMTAVFAFGQLLGRLTSRGHTLGLGFLVVESIWPASFFECGVQLTFLALLGLLVSSWWIEPTQVPEEIKLEKQAIRRFAERHLWRPLVSSTGAVLYTMPALIAWFHAFVPTGTLNNIWTIPIFSMVCICWGGISLLFTFLHLPWSGQLLDANLAAVDWLLHALERQSEILGQLGLGYQQLSDNSITQIVVVWSIGLICLTRLSYRRGRCPGVMNCP